MTSCFSLLTCYNLTLAIRPLKYLFSKTKKQQQQNINNRDRKERIKNWCYCFKLITNYWSCQSNRLCMYYRFKRKALYRIRINCCNLCILCQDDVWINYHFCFLFFSRIRQHDSLCGESQLDQLLYTRFYLFCKNNISYWVFRFSERVLFEPSN